MEFALAGKAWQNRAMTGAIEISAHEVRIVAALKASGEWMSSRDVAREAKVAPRTARHHLRRLADIGILEEAEVFPGHRYRFSAKSDRTPHYKRILAAAAALRVAVA